MFKWLFRTGRKATSKSLVPVPPRPSNVRNEAETGAQLPALQSALQHHQAGRLAEAEAAYYEVLAADPDNFDALQLSGVIAFQRGEHETAVDRISQALARNPSNAAAQNNLGAVFRAQGRLDEAVLCFRKALALKPDYIDAHTNLAAVLVTQGKLDEAGAAYANVLSLKPDSPTACLSLGNLRAAQGDRAAAIQCYRQALALKPDYFEASFNLGNALKDAGELDEAGAQFRKALALQPDSAAACINLGNVLKDEGRVGEAVVCYERAIALDPGIPEAHLNLGSAYKEQDRLDDAVACYRRALALEPRLPDAHYGLGNALKDTGKLEEAIACYRAALALRADFAEAHYALGNALRDQDELQEIVDCYGQALSLKPDYTEARWALAMCQIPAVCETEADPAHFRTRFSEELAELERWFDATRLADGFKAVGVMQPFLLAYQEENNLALLRRYGELCSRIMSAWLERQNFRRVGTRNAGAPMRVGVVSQYFFNHSVWNAIVKSWFQHLDRARYSLHAFYLGMRQDQETLFASSNASHFEEGRRDLRHWVEAIIGQELDVIIYPEIGMDPMTVRLASLRLAPIQVASWGHPETTGLPTIDYYLSAADLEPPNARENYSERLIALPHLGCCYKPVPVVPASPDPRGFDFDPTTPVFLCPGVPFKYAPRHDRVLTDIARRLGRCHFVFFTHRLSKLSQKLKQRLERVFAHNRLDAEQFVRFIPWQSSPGFYGWLQRADVFLDTIGFSGFNTAIQAAEAGIPLVTREGRFMRGRLASGILKRMGLRELVADTEDDYVVLAVRLAQDRDYRRHIRERMEASRHRLFEDLAPVHALENVLVEAANRR